MPHPDIAVYMYLVGPVNIKDYRHTIKCMSMADTVMHSHYDIA